MIGVYKLLKVSHSGTLPLALAIIGSLYGFANIDSRKLDNNLVPVYPSLLIKRYRSTGYELVSQDDLL